MRVTSLNVGFMPLVDAAPLIMAQEMGFAGDEGLSLDLERAPSWSALRDMLSFGQLDAAHMLSPVPVAAALRLGGNGVALAAVSVLSVNGNVIGVNQELTERLKSEGHDFAFSDAHAAGQALIKAMDRELRLGVPFPFSMHAELVLYWLSALGLTAPDKVKIRTVPPPLMAGALKNGEIDAFCVGEPWGSRAVELGVGSLLLPGKAIWAFAPEKVLATRQNWANDHEDLCHRLIRAVWRASHWLADPVSRTLTAEVLARPHYLDVPAELIDRALTGQMVIGGTGEIREVPRFVEFHAGAANFPWRSQAEWIGRQLASRNGFDLDVAGQIASTVFRSDLYRAALGPTAADLPGASSKVEGSLSHDSAVASARGQLILPPDAFFDGLIFEPIAH
ncbi:ABC transporter substrate-binding protein [Ruegeria lacuscaerulensis]|uniref:ABC transporter substrate-binding protein n=1 Tax=Ruegeria lacuscaerulensis TaxID=55218 RepID=UPI00147B7E74|nr:ABC transporter substrate-binding protein [Ruegeria lacuscaerulensis]